MVFNGAWTTGVTPNEYLDTPVGFNAKSHTVAAATVPTDADGNKILQPGTVMANITSGDGSGKVGPFEPNTISNEVQQFGLGAASAGTFTISFDGETTAAIAYNATAATVQAALLAMSNMQPGDVVGSGGPLPGTAVVLTFGGQWLNKDVPAITISGGGLTGATVTISTTTAGGEGSDGATDGRQTYGNIVGINDTFLPYELLEGDAEVAVMITGRVKKASLYIIAANGTYTKGDPGETCTNALRSAALDILVV